MDRKVNFVVLLALATVNAGVIPAPRVLEGPSSKTTIIGPDGSKISAFAPGGKIVLDENAGPLPQGAPEVFAVEGVAQPVPVPQTEIREVIPVVEPKTEEDSLAIDALPVEDSEAADLTKSAATENITQIDATTVVVPVKVTDESVGETTESSIEEKVTETPFNVVSLPKEIEGVAARAVNPQPAVAYIHDTPLYVPEISQFSGEYLPEHLQEEPVLGW